ncbi:MAG: hypothetical protein QXF26_10455, partial [Candidatus Bathyarchaeia archaeon]
INPQSSAEVIVSLSADETIEFTEEWISFISKNRPEKSLLENLRLQLNQYSNGEVIDVEPKDLGNGASISYKRRTPSGNLKEIHFTPVKITQGRYKIIFFSTSFTDIKVVVIGL